MRRFVFDFELWFHLDDMNYDQKFRRFTFEIVFLLFLLLIDRNVQGKSDPLKKSSNVLEDEKRVFDSNFGNNKNYAIDDCIPLAFGDFNADKIVDIFCRNTLGNLVAESINDESTVFLRL